MNIEVRTFVFQSEMPTLTRERFQILVSHVAMTGSIRADMFPASTVTIDRP